MSNIGKSTKGFKCECGTWYVFSAWVHAHWYELLFHKCDNCNAEHVMKAGKVKLTKHGVKIKSKTVAPSRSS